MPPWHERARDWVRTGWRDWSPLERALLIVIVTVFLTLVYLGVTGRMEALLPGAPPQ